MNEPPSTDFVIRPYRPADRPAVRRICVACSWFGRVEPGAIPDDWIWAEYWTRYFTDRDPRRTWVVEPPSGEVVGYLSATTDQARVLGYLPFLFPGIVLRAIRKRLLSRPAPRAAAKAMLAAVLRGQLRLPPVAARDYPSTFHFNLLPEARGCGVGSRLFDTYLSHMRALGVRGIHAQPMSINPAVPAFLAHRGFRMIDAWPLTAFEHVTREPIALQTWVRRV